MDGVGGRHHHPPRSGPKSFLPCPKQPFFLGEGCASGLILAPSTPFLDSPHSVAGVLVCLLEYPRSKRKKGSTMERW